MNKKRLFLFEISDIFANQVYLPYSSGVVWSYAEDDKRIKDNYILADWIFFRQNISSIIDKIENPDVLAFSCFMWNWNINYEIATIIKQKYPDCLVIFGGQHQPLADRNTGFFSKHPFVDILVHGEGEKTFKDILLENLTKNPSFENVNGITLNRAGEEHRTPPQERLKSLQETPSPYLNGLFERLMEKTEKQLSYSAIVESARGCPFSCAFCEIGSKYYQKIKKNYQRTKKEIEWIAQKKIEYITDANSNFGIFYDLDYDLAEFVKSTKKKFSYPQAFRVTWVKGQADKVIDIAMKFEEAGVQKGMTIALQSMNSTVLKAIKRKNIDDGKLVEFIQMYEGEGISSYVELIWGLPEETLDSFIDGVCSIMEMGYHNYLDIHFMMVLPNAPIASEDYTKTYNIVTSKTQPRFSHRHIDGELSIDTVNFLTESNSFSKEEWLEGHQFRWVVIFGHYLGPLQFIARGLNKVYQISYKNFYVSLITFFKDNPATFIGSEYKKILNDTRKILRNERHWGVVLKDVSDINWEVDEVMCIKIASNTGIFYEEINTFVLQTFSFVDKQVLSELIKYQNLRLHNPHTQYPKKERFLFNLHDVIEKDENLQACENEVSCLGKNYNSNVYEWAKEVLWFNRRVGAYKTKVSQVVNVEKVALSVD